MDVKLLNAANELINDILLFNESIKKYFNPDSYYNFTEYLSGVRDDLDCLGDEIGGSSVKKSFFQFYLYDFIINKSTQGNKRKSDIFRLTYEEYKKKHNSRSFYQASVHEELKVLYILSCNINEENKLKIYKKEYNSLIYRYCHLLTISNESKDDYSLNLLNNIKSRYGEIPDFTINKTIELEKIGIDINLNFSFCNDLKLENELKSNLDCIDLSFNQFSFSPLSNDKISDKIPVDEDARLKAEKIEIRGEINESAKIKELEKAKLKEEAKEKARIKELEKAKLKEEAEEKARLLAEQKLADKMQREAESKEKARIKELEKAKLKEEAEEKARLLAEQKLADKMQREAEAKEKARIEKHIIESEYKAWIKGADFLEEVKIGNQIWLKKNLDVPCFRNGDIILEVKTEDGWKNANKMKTPAWCYYNNDKVNGEQFGKLYNWFAVNDPRGLAPEGWQIPTKEEWKELIDNLGGPYESDLKIKSIYTWKKKEYCGNDLSGFGGLPAGYRMNGLFWEIGRAGKFWTSSEKNINKAWCRSIYYHFNYVEEEIVSKEEGMSIRLIKNS